MIMSRVVTYQLPPGDYIQELVFIEKFHDPLNSGHVLLKYYFMSVNKNHNRTEDWRSKAEVWMLYFQLPKFD